MRTDLAARQPDRFLLAALPIRRRTLIINAALLVILIVAAAHGPASIPYRDVARLLVRGIGFPVAADLPLSDYAIVNQVRLPRILVGMLIGASLAVSGATIQGIFRNPLADPAIIGVSVGGSLGAVIAITTGLATDNLCIMPIFAFLGSMGSATCVCLMSLVRGHTQPATLLLAGIAMNALRGALISTLLLFNNKFIEVQAI